ncbi:ATP-binding cassette domain-containing protein [Erysipelothrix aquatica]|uniref:ATP-binding cassette domain-containing protein n=1 Tax=Erysipelothrix aquatica TaxID=2683714 RepID=UPI0022A7D3DA|nr:ATP-binding cassette domain-containing protein [Erysipelothrix aquatica]
MRKSFKGMIVLDGLSLEVKKGALIHIRGGNGSGKSTLLKLIAKLNEPDSGSVYVDETQKLVV